jgi:hypothetical protein
LNHFPPFSWDRVPVYAHVGKASGDFTPEELDFLATHFDFITIEKHQASHQHGNTLRIPFIDFPIIQILPVKQKFPPICFFGFG